MRSDSGQQLGDIGWLNNPYNIREACKLKNVPKSGKSPKQAWAELGQAQLQLELRFNLIKVCCIILTSFFAGLRPAQKLAPERS